MKKTGLFLLLACLTIFSLHASSSNFKPSIYSKAEGRSGSQSVWSSILRFYGWLRKMCARRRGKSGSARGLLRTIIWSEIYRIYCTIMTIRCLKLILEGSDAAYRSFIAAQEEPVLPAPVLIFYTCRASVCRGPSGEDCLPCRWRRLWKRL